MNPQATVEIEFVTQMGGLEVATIQHDTFSMLEVSKSRDGRNAFNLTVFRQYEDRAGGEDLSIDLTAHEAGRLAAILATSPTPAAEGIVEQIRAAHRSAKPNPVSNPAWANAEHDIGVLLAEIGRLTAERDAARDNALEEAATAVESHSPIRPAFTTEDEGGIKWQHEAVQLPIYNPPRLASAIRSLKGVSTP